MASIIEDSDKKELLNIILKELLSNDRRPAYEYMRNTLLSSSPDLICALGCVTQEINDDECELLLNAEEEQLFTLFKFRKQTLKDLIELLEHRIFASEDNDGTIITVPKKVLLTCWLLTSNEHYFIASEFFRISIRSVLTVFHEVCTELTKLAVHLISWPSEIEQQQIINEFEAAYEFPGVVGVIGSMLFKINSQSNNATSESENSIVIQAVCDHQMIFRDISAGVPNNRSPAEILKDSSLYRKLISRTNPLIKPQTFIIGSKYYPQLANLLTPYAPEVRGQPLDSSEQSFNERHSFVENLIHKCFDMLRGRFSKLNCINVSEISKATRIVIASCVLHNFALIRGDVWM